MLIIASSGYIAGSTQLLNIDMHAIWVAISDHTSSQVHTNIRSKWYLVNPDCGYENQVVDCESW
jgi:hypothetical protein